MASRKGKTGIIVQTRMGSTRLPGKVMLDLCGKPVIAHVVERLEKSETADEIIIATTTLAGDDIIEETASEVGALCFRGSESDVLSRYYFAALERQIEIVVRVTSDCPLIDSRIIDQLVRIFAAGDYDLAANVHFDQHNRTYPRGLDAEVFSFSVLKQAHENAGETYQREHVTPYLYEHCQRIYCKKHEPDLSKYRWTLDTNEDFELIRRIYGSLYKGNHDFYMEDILRLFDEDPGLIDINAEIEQKKMK